jgi:2-polyprenyl-3-methyl-5-hydroxy-6-metoxy-1,4-benzoquinol methylase
LFISEWISNVLERNSLLAAVYKKQKVLLLKAGFLYPKYKGKSAGFDKLYAIEDPYQVKSKEDLPRVRESTVFLLTNSKARESLLDVGCGEGTITRKLSTYFSTAVGTDVSRKALRRAKKSSRAIYVKSEMEHLPFRDESVDVITCFEALYYASNPQKALKEFYKILRNNGTLILSTHATFENYLPPKRLIPKLKAVFLREPEIVERNYWSDINDRVFIMIKKNPIY